MEQVTQVRNARITRRPRSDRTRAFKSLTLRSTLPAALPPLTAHAPSYRSKPPRRKLYFLNGIFEVSVTQVDISRATTGRKTFHLAPYFHDLSGMFLSVLGADRFARQRQGDLEGHESQYQHRFHAAPERDSSFTWSGKIDGGLEDHGWGFGKTEGEKEKTGRETLKTTWRP
ncbi:MAG: hypothetical protein QE267_09270 [Akkermansiaceae bacterium]|nr:hypothetical protein [Akkermansiaceae bacterium]